MRADGVVEQLVPASKISYQTQHALSKVVVNFDLPMILAEFIGNLIEKQELIKIPEKPRETHDLTCFTSLTYTST